MIRQRNKFLTFLFSFIPGCGHLYMGFMKRGLSMLVMLFAIIFMASLFDGAIAFLIFVLWFYSFFEAINLMSLPPERFAQFKDRYLFSYDDSDSLGLFVSRHKKGIGIGLVVAGIGLLFYTLKYPLLDSIYFLVGDAAYQAVSSILQYIPRIVVAIVIVFLGIRLISRQKRVVLEENAEV